MGIKEKEEPKYFLECGDFENNEDYADRVDDFGKEFPEFFEENSDTANAENKNA